MSHSPKLLVLAVDAASAPLLERWAGDGTLPNLAAFLSGSLVAPTWNVEGLFIGSGWPCFSSAVNPAQHGVYWIYTVRPSTYEIGMCTAEELGRRQALWEVLAAAGRRVVMVDVPFARPLPKLNGVQVVEWGTHDAIFGLHTTPAGLGSRLLADYGPHPSPRVCDTGSRSPEEYRRFTDQLVKGAAIRSRMTRGLLASGDWDFGMQVFSEAHCAGHQLWHTHDPAHPGYDPAGTDLVREVYVGIDSAIGEIVAAQDPDTTIAVMSLHGMRTIYGCHPLTADILLKLGFMTRASTTAHDPATGGATLGGKLRQLYRMLPVGIRRPIYELRQALGSKVLGRGDPLDLDPARSVCFDVGLDPTVSAIRLNIRGREPQGIVEPGEESARVSRQIEAAFLELVDPDSGRRLVHRVLRSAELFEGPYLDQLPDLLIEWDPEFPLGTSAIPNSKHSLIRAHSPRVGTLEYDNSYCRTGDHDIGGLIAVRGPGVEPGRVGRTISTLDLAPTFTRMLGVEFAGVEGRPAPELLGLASARAEEGAPGG